LSHPYSVGIELHAIVGVRVGDGSLALIALVEGNIAQIEHVFFHIGLAGWRRLDSDALESEVGIERVGHAVEFEMEILGVHSHSARVQTIDPVVVIGDEEFMLVG